MGQLKSAFLAYDVRQGKQTGGVDLIGAYISGVPADALPGATRFYIVGDYQFDEQERAAAHKFDAKVFAPADTPMARWTADPSVVAPYSIPPAAGGLAGTIFAVK